MVDVLRRYSISKCRCGHRACQSWFVSPVADVPGVGFSERQALAVSKLLAAMDETKPADQASLLLEVIRIVRGEP